MPYYKDQNNKLHYLDDATFSHLLPSHCLAITDAEAELLSAPSTPPQADLIAGYTIAIQKRLDDFAKTRNYDGILSACTYATSMIPQFATEGQRCVELRDATWMAGYAILADVEAGNRPIPTIQQVLSELPELTWEDP